MCDRSPLFFFEAKSIINNLLTQTVELFDLSVNLIESSQLNQFLLERNQNRDFHNFAPLAPCKLNYNIENDIDTFIRRLYTSCRLIKSNLRSLHAARLTSPNDYVVIDDEIFEAIEIFTSKLNKKIWKSREETIRISFIQISKFFKFLLEQLYGIRIVRDSLVLQPVVIRIIRLLFFIAQELRKVARSISPVAIRKRFTVAQDQQICHEPDRIDKTDNKQIFRIIEVLPLSSDNNKQNEFPVLSNEKKSDYLKVRNDNHRVSPSPSLTTVISARDSTLDFDEDEFYRLANLERDDDDEF